MKKKKTEPNPRQILKDLDIKDTQYLKKIKILHELILEPDCGHIIPEDIVKWCKSVGFKPECNFEDRTSWWTCSNRD